MDDCFILSLVAKDGGVQVFYTLVLFACYGLFLGNAIFIYLKETVLDVFAGFHNNIDLYNLLKKASEKFKFKLIDTIQAKFKEKFITPVYDHKKVRVVAGPPPPLMFNGVLRR